MADAYSKEVSSAPHRFLLISKCNGLHRALALHPDSSHHSHAPTLLPFHVQLIVWSSNELHEQSFHTATDSAAKAETWQIVPKQPAVTCPVPRENQNLNPGSSEGRVRSAARGPVL